MKPFDSNSVVTLAHLTVQREGEEYTIGDPRIPRFIRVPEPAVFVIERCDGTSTVEEVREQILKDKGLEIDVLDFVSNLRAIGLVSEVAEREAAVSRRPKGIIRTAERLGAVMFRSHAKWFYLLVILAVIVLFWSRPGLLPHYADMFVLPVIGGNSLLVSLTACVLIFLHECAHLLAAFGAGVPARMRVNIRYIFVVAETDMTGLWGHEKAKRYFPYLAGMAWDSALMLIALLVQMGVAEGSFIYLFARLVVLLLALGILSQFMVFLRTDVYYVLGNYTHSPDLARSGKLFIRKLWRRNNETRAQWEGLPATEQNAAKWFGTAYFVGIASLTVVFVLFSVPGGYTALKSALSQVRNYSIQSIPFWDGAIILSLALFRLALYGKGAQTAIRDRKSKRGVHQA
ncbi:PqqD family protein [Cohnella cholangitidis]|uniref:PqqD family protein n=1 Tax=Cohnella cholangitidis TaxID=2598458 RepID=A0A7G5BUN6_9BACL|nr:PqqD family protein [Cohnella cholangitidis]QMV40670.1 PqqD family protein [Cohnella cholangitidis]